MSDQAPDATVRYGDNDDAVIDLHLPPTASERLLVLLHGGFWKAAWDRRHTRPMARALADEGWVVATPEYRRVGNGGGWPVTGDDVRAACTRLPGLLAGLDLPTSHTVVTGHSAGGHLALWLAATGHPVDRVVALAPVCDLDEAVRLRLGDDAAAAMLGGHEAAEADPMRLLDVRPGCEVAVVHGIEDDVVPVSLSRGLVRRHPWIALHEVSGGHFEVIEPASPAWPTVVEAFI